MLMAAVPLAEQILAVLKEGLSAWKTFIETRQEAYNRKKDKQRTMAIESAEKLIFEIDELIVTIKTQHPDVVKEKPISGLLNQIEHFRRRFFKYN